MHRYSLPLLFACAVLMGLLALGAFVPPGQIRAIVGGREGYAHSFGLGAVAFLLALALPTWWWKGAALLLTASAFVELLQPLVGRGAQLADMAANFIGLGIGTLSAAGLLHLTLWRRNRSEKKVPTATAPATTRAKKKNP